MSRKEAIENFKALDDISHVLTVPARYIGTVNEVEQEMYLFQDDKFIFQTVNYIPGLLKIFEEILDNSVDAYLNDKNRKPITIKVNIDKKSVRVVDTGSGIPVVKYVDKDGNLPEVHNKYLPELAWSRLKSGGSFKKERVGAGTHGEGASLTNIFSKSFIGITNDGSKVCSVKCSNNMRDIKTTVKTAKSESGTDVYFEPDLKIFNLSEITQIHIDLIYQRLINLSVAFPEIKFFFNNKKVALTSKNFLNLFSEENVSIQSDNALIGVFPSSTDDFQQYSFVNGLRISKGGSHIDYTLSQILAPIKEKLEKKFKTIKNGDIKNKLGLVVFLKDFKNPSFNSQTKEVLANPINSIVEHLDGKIDFSNFCKKILKNGSIIDPIIESFKLKEELKSRQDLKKSKKVKIKSDKFMPTIGKKSYLILTEGLCLEKNQEVFVISENKHLPICEIKEGDFVLTHKQEIQMVVGKSTSLKDCVKIKLKSGREVICSKGHRWYVYDKDTKTFDFKLTKELDLSKDKFVINKLSQGFSLDEINIEDWKGEEQEVYHKRVYGKTYTTAVSNSHKFLVFDEELVEFLIKETTELDIGKHKMVILEEDK